MGRERHIVSKFRRILTVKIVIEDSKRYNNTVECEILKLWITEREMK